MYHHNDTTFSEEAIKATYAKVLGSAVNPVLREGNEIMIFEKHFKIVIKIISISGNSDRRCAAPVKEHAKKITKRSPAMRPWKENGQRTCVNSMSDGDFFSSEQSHIMPKAGSVKITLHQADGTTKVLKDNHPLQAGEVISFLKLVFFVYLYTFYF